MKILLVTNKVKTYALGFQNTFAVLHGLGHEIIWAADFSKFVGDVSIIPCKTKQISINTNPLKPCNYNAYRQLCEIIGQEKIDVVQCSTPIGGTLARLAAKKKRVPFVIYAVHGFLFFKGAPLINRTVYKWEELILAHYTDVVITINKEDLAAAQKFKIRGGRNPYMVHGAGVNVGVVVDVDKKRKRKEIGIPEDAFAIVSAGELNKNKNTKVMIEAIEELGNPNVCYVVCGEGKEYNNLVQTAEALGVSRQVLFLGYRTDVAEIMVCSDAFTMPSFREGTPRALLEAMDLGLPCIGSKTRGMADLIEEGIGGYLCKPNDKKAFAAALKKLINDPALCISMGERNREKAKEYSKEVVQRELYEIYKEILK